MYKETSTGSWEVEIKESLYPWTSSEQPCLAPDFYGSHRKPALCTSSFLVDSSFQWLFYKLSWSCNDDKGFPEKEKPRRREGLCVSSQTQQGLWSKDRDSICAMRKSAWTGLGTLGTEVTSCGSLVVLSSGWHSAPRPWGLLSKVPDFLKTVLWAVKMAMMMTHGLQELRPHCVSGTLHYICCTHDLFTFP